ncbi:MAG: DUF503 domain-containing protein [Armatimonadota bacterium]
MSMVVGICSMELYIPEANSLKDKRSVVKSMLEGMRNKFNVSAAEVEHLDTWRRAGVGIACVSNSQKHANEVLNKVVDWVEANPRVNVSAVELDFY